MLGARRPGRGGDLSPELQHRGVVVGYAIFGLLLIPVVAAGIAGPSFPSHAILTYPKQLAAAAITVVTAAALGAFKLTLVRNSTVHWLTVCALSVAAFLSGSVAGTITNLFVIGDPLSKADMVDFVVKPMFWLALLGTPCALGLGLLLSQALTIRLTPPLSLDR